MVRIERKMRWQVGAIMRLLVAVGLMGQSAPAAWAQLREVDPALDVAVEALIAHDPVVANDPELADLCRQVAEATIIDPRERSAVTQEVAALQREGVDLATVIPTEVREAAREQFTAVQGQMQEQLETLRTSDPEKAKEVELMMREGERQMDAFSRGENYTPSPEMLEHAKDMFGEWKESLLEQGAPPEMLARAEVEFTRWAGGEMTGPMGMGGDLGPGQDMGPPPAEHFGSLLAEGKITQEEYSTAMEGLEAWKAAEGDPDKMKELMEKYGGSPEFSHDQPLHDMPEFMGPNFDPAQAPEIYREMMEQHQFEFEQNFREFEQFQPPENNTYDNLQQQQFDNFNPPPGGTPPAEVLVATHDHNSDTVPDEYHYDTNSDGLADHAHPTPH